MDTVLRLRVPTHRVSRRAILWWTVRSAWVWLVVVVGQVLAGVFATGAPSWLPDTTVAAAVVGLVHVLVMPQWRYRVHRWESTADAVYTRSGWLNQQWRVAPASRIQTVDIKRGPLEQLLRLATVTITTASAAGPLEIAGLDHDEATGLVRDLTAVTQASSGDAT